MSAALTGNPYVDHMLTNQLTHTDAVANVTLALAYEQRTANLIAYSKHIDDTDRSVIDQIIDRLGLNGDK